jgi:hypothetical protein
MYVETSAPTNLRLQQLVVNNNKEDTTNARNGRNRKICPITYIELNSDNSIKIGKTIYSSSGLKDLWKGRLPNQNYGFLEYYYVIRMTRDPMTNVNFTDGDTRDICVLLFNKIERSFLEKYIQHK